jgi:hypothetical protein
MISREDPRRASLLTLSHKDGTYVSSICVLTDAPCFRHKIHQAVGTFN